MYYTLNQSEYDLYSNQRIMEGEMREADRLRMRGREGGREGKRKRERNSEKE